MLRPCNLVRAGGLIGVIGGARYDLVADRCPACRKRCQWYEGQREYWEMLGVRHVSRPLGRNKDEDKTA